MMPLRATLGTPDECLHAALAQARLAASIGDHALAETLLRGVVALDPKTPHAAAELAAVLLAQTLAGRRDPSEAHGWARWALEVDPSDALARTVEQRLARLMRA